MSYFSDISIDDMSPLGSKPGTPSSHKGYCLDEEFLVRTSDGELVLDYTGWLDGTVEGPEELEEEPDELWLWLGEKDSPPTDAEMQRMFSASGGADLALALKD